MISVNAFYDHREDAIMNFKNKIKLTIQPKVPDRDQIFDTNLIVSHLLSKSVRKVQHTMQHQPRIHSTKKSEQKI